MSESSWFSNFGVLSNISSSILQATSKVSNAVQKTIQQQSPNEEQTSESTRDLTSFLTDLGSSVLKSAQQLKQAVEETTIIGNFTKEQDKFLTEKRIKERAEETAVPPWVGYKEEEEMKKQILALSQEKRYFIRNPPPGADYHFDMTAFYPVALVTLEVDENLKQMRFNLVPKQINEETFWKNYFYRVSLIKQSTQLAALTNENNIQSIDENKSLSISTRRTSDLQENISDINQEFVSEDYDTSAINMDDIRREIEQLSIPKKSPDIDESEWDNELENVSPEEFEAQLNQMLAEGIH